MPMRNTYQQNQSPRQLYMQLLVGLKKHLLIANDTTVKKDVRLTSLANLAEVVEYVLIDTNTELPELERSILVRFFLLLLVKIKHAMVAIHDTPESFDQEIGFISTLMKI